jgi:Xaa-Pro aminopeptidase
LVRIAGLIESLVSRKEPGEIKSIRKAAGISDAVFKLIVRKIRPGVRERELAAEISFLQKKFGADGDAFEPIVASGKRSALPHARPTSRAIRKGDLVLLDFGCTVDGYCSDMTRTISVGPASTRTRSLYASVLEARNLAVSLVCPGVAVRELDSRVRQHFRKAGLSRFFTHSLGHGIGLQVHERPRVSSMSNEVLAPGNVITIEPGIYIPSIGGIRIEDDVLVTTGGCQVLNNATRELLVV